MEKLAIASINGELFLSKVNLLLKEKVDCFHITKTRNSPDIEAILISMKRFSELERTSALEKIFYSKAQQYLQDSTSEVLDIIQGRSEKCPCTDLDKNQFACFGLYRDGEENNPLTILIHPEHYYALIEN